MILRSIFQSKKNKTIKKQISVSKSIKPIVIVDVGCRWGFAERFLGSQYHKDMKIFGFDPDEKECTRLQESYENLPAGFISCVPTALAEKSGRRNLYITKEPACSSLYPPIKHLSDEYPALECMTLDKVITIDVTTLFDWATKNSLSSVDYIKIDTQGSELEILKGAGSYLSTARCIDIEVEFNPLYEGQSLFFEVDAYLRKNGFSLWRFSNMVHYSANKELVELDDINSVCFDDFSRQTTQAFGGQLFWADARYINTKVLLAGGDDHGVQRARDTLLFEALGMRDILRQLAADGVS